MAEDQVTETVVVVRPRGPYLVPGDVAVRRTTIVTTENGESATYMPRARLNPKGNTIWCGAFSWSDAGRVSRKALRSRTSLILIRA